MRLPLRRKRSRYERAKRAFLDMMRERKRARRQRPAPRATPVQRVAAHDISDGEEDFSGLHWMTAGLFLAAGAEAALGERRGDYRDDAIRWAPLVAAPIAAAAQAARALSTSPTTRMISKLANGVALGVGAAGLASSINDAKRDRQYDDDDPASVIDNLPSLAPLAFGAVGLLGLLLDSEEEEAEYRPRSRPRQTIRIRV